MIFSVLSRYYYILPTSLTIGNLLLKSSSHFAFTTVTLNFVISSHLDQGCSTCGAKLPCHQLWSFILQYCYQLWNPSFFCPMNFTNNARHGFLWASAYPVFALLRWSGQPPRRVLAQTLLQYRWGADLADLTSSIKKERDKIPRLHRTGERQICLTRVGVGERESW